MHRVVNAALIAAVAAALPASLEAQPAAAKVAVCSLLPTAEVKQHLPWIKALDAMPPEEEAIGAYGSSCNYPSVTIQVMPFSKQAIDAERAKGGLEAVGGVGDEAWFHNNRNRYAELYVRVGARLLTVQANVSTTIDAVKPGTLSLAKALAAKLQ
jgi:hypothetical protein